MPRSRSNSPLFGNISNEKTIDKPRRQRSKYGSKKYYEYHRQRLAIKTDIDYYDKSNVNDSLLQLYENESSSPVFISPGYTLFGKPSPMEFGFGLFRQKYGIQSD